MAVDFLIDSSALWRIQRSPEIRERWRERVARGEVGSCQIQRVEFLRSARNHTELADMSAMFDALYPDVPTTAAAWARVGDLQARMTGGGAALAMSVVDYVIAATAISRDLVVVHDDRDFTTAGRFVTDLREVGVGTTA